MPFLHNYAWVNFSDRMPGQRDADEHGNIELLEKNGASREGMWNWVHTDELWYANGFAAWRPLRRASTRGEKS